jgi:glutamine amidotransferase-like uncharacterized protein
MSKKSIILLALLIISPVIIYFLWPTDESRIRKLFREGTKAVEARKLEDVMSKVSYNYTDEHGLAYITLKQGMDRALKEMSGIRIEYEIKGIQVKDKSASAEMDIRVIASYGKDTGYVLGDAARPAHLKFSLEKERTAWLINSSEGLKVEF